MKTLILISLTTLFIQCDLPPTPPPTKIREDTSATLSSDLPCDPQLWARTYGAMERFGERPARQVLKHRCVTVRGQIVSGPLRMMDGDVKWKIQVDPLTYQFGFYKEAELLGPGNQGLLTVELVCSTPVTNKGCENCKNACRDYKRLYDDKTINQFTKGKWIDVTGELISDTGPSKESPQGGHGWKEIHPVTSIKLVNR